MAFFGTKAFLSVCVAAVDGLNASSYGVDVSCDYTKTPDECGENIKGYTKNVMADHNWEGEILGPSASGAALYLVGTGVTPPVGVWGNNMSPGANFVCTKAGPKFTRGDWATFSFTLNNSEGI